MGIPALLDHTSHNCFGADRRAVCFGHFSECFSDHRHYILAKCDTVLPPRYGIMKSTQSKYKALRQALRQALALEKEEERMRKDYPPGTCNAEDAWSDYYKEVEANKKLLRKLTRS